MPVRPLTISLALLAVLFVRPSIAAAQTRYTENLPAQFASRAEAEQNGCDFSHVEGPSVDACVLTGFGANQMDVLIYTPAPDSFLPRNKTHRGHVV